MGCSFGKNQVHIVNSTDPKLAGKNVDPDKGPDRGGSATSKTSRHSGDSGFDDEDLPIISQQMALQKNILRQPVLASGKDVERPEEKNILATLHEEGLIQRPIANRAFAVSFEVFAENSEFPGVLKKPPPRLAKLENKKRKKKVLTEEEIKEKLRQAEERRKMQEQIRVSRAHQLIVKSDIQTSIDTYAQTLKEMDETAKSKEEIAAENREKKLKEKLERLQKKKEHAEEVRKRRLLAVAAGIPAENSEGISTGTPSMASHPDRDMSAE